MKLINKVKGSIRLKFSVFTGIFLILLLAVLSVYIYRTKEKLLYQNLLSRGGNLVRIYNPLVSRAMQFKDDLTLISYMQNIIEQPDVIHTMLIDSNGTVLAHNMVGEAGKNYSNDYVNQLLKLDGLKTFRIRIERHKYAVYDFCIPLFVQGVKAGILRVGFSTREIKLSLGKYIENILLVCIIVLFFGILGSYLFANIILAPLNRVKEIVEDLNKGNPLGEITIKTQDEFSELVNLIKELNKKINDNYQKHQQDIDTLKKNFYAYLQKTGSSMTGEVILTDEENKIVYINDTGKTLLHANQEDITGRHILEIARNVEFVELLKKAMKNPDIPVVEELKSTNHKVKILAIQNESKDLLGIVVTSN